jgi:hypothetical protein
LKQHYAAGGHDHPVSQHGQGHGEGHSTHSHDGGLTFHRHD